MSLELSAADVLAARREWARREVAGYAQMVDIPTVPIGAEDADQFKTLRIERLADHHRLILAALQRVAGPEEHNVMFFFPPGSAKSTYSDVVFIPWFLATNPRSTAILTSYGSTLAAKQGRRARQLLSSASHRTLFPDALLSADKSAADEWTLTNGSEFMAGGILSGITGNRGDLVVIDDPIKGREEADSETIRKKTREAYEDDIVSRLKPNGSQAMILTRWHEDDLAGGILPENWDGESGPIHCRDGRTWNVFRVPAIADRPDDPLGRAYGETLWPEWFAPSHWEPFRRNPRTWASLYQQQPAPEEGTFFKREWFTLYQDDDKLPAMNRYGTSDYAVTDDGGDFTWHLVWGLHEEEMWLLDGWYGQTTSDLWAERKIDLMKKHSPLCWFGEGGQIQKAVEPYLRRRMRERKTYSRLEWMQSINDKASRARGFQARAAQGLVRLPDNELGHRVLDELLKFPAGKHDDAVDACSMMGRAIDETHPAIIQTPEPPPKRQHDYTLVVEDDPLDESRLL